MKRRCRETFSSTASCRRSARVNAELNMLTTSPAADLSRSESMPAVMDGNVIPTINAIRLTTTSISSSVTPADRALRALLLPTEDVGIRSITARLTIGSIREDVRLVAVISGVLVNIGVPPGVQRYVLCRVWPLPLLYPLG